MILLFKSENMIIIIETEGLSLKGRLISACTYTEIYLII